MDAAQHMVNLDDLHPAHMVGYDQGFAHGQRLADNDRAHAILHAYAVKMAGLAIRTARARHGDGWASEIARQASGEDW